VNGDPEQEQSVGDIEGMVIARNAQVLCSYEGPGTNLMPVLRKVCENSFRLGYGDKRTFQKDDFIVYVYITTWQEGGDETMPNAIEGDFSVDVPKLVAVCFARRGFSSRYAFSFLDDIAQEARVFESQIASGAQEDNWSMFKVKMRIASDRYSSDKTTAKIRTVQHRLEETKVLIQDDISLALERGEKIDEVLEKTDQLNLDSYAMRTGTKSLLKETQKRSCSTSTVVCIVFSIFMFLVLAAGTVVFFIEFYPHLHPHHKSSSSHFTSDEYLD